MKVTANILKKDQIAQKVNKKIKKIKKNNTFQLGQITSN